MTTSRREFIKTAGVVAGVAIVPSSLPSWISDVDTAEAVAAESVNKSELADIALTQARKLGCSYADIRINRYRTESISTREKQVQNVSRSQNFGFGVRVLFKGTGIASAASHGAEVRADASGSAISRGPLVYQRGCVTLARVPRSRRTAEPFEKDRSSTDR